MRAQFMLRLAAAGVATLLATTGGLWAFCESSVETYAVFQCSDRAYFAPVPSPFTPANVTGVFWQLGFGNNLSNTGDGTDGTGVRSKSNFNGNDSGTFAVNILNASVAFPGEGFPAGSVCLGSNNWANTGIDGCCDNPRPGIQFYYNNVYNPYGPYPYPGDDNILNPYFGTYFNSILYYGYYSRGSLMDYPTAVLLKTPVDPNMGSSYFAVAAVTNMDRNNSGNGDNGPCSPSPGSNQAPCDIRQGFYNFDDVTNGQPNAIDGQNNVIPWQIPPRPFFNITAGDPNDPNATLTVDFNWVAPTMYSDQRSIPSNNPTHAPADPNAAIGPGVVDIASKFGVFRYLLQVAPEADPTFSSPTQEILCLRQAGRSDPECTSPTTATVSMLSSECLRIITRIGVEPRETTTTNSDNCRNGRCGDLGYEVAGPRECPGTSTCVPSAELCDGLDNDCDGIVDNGFGLGQACNGVGECGAGVLECSPSDPNLTICSTDPNGTMDESVPELCDSLDNDCDASTDEDFVLGGACNGTGVCMTDPNGGPGVVECSASDPNTTQCSLDPGGSEDQSGPMELCDLLDNDCDGMTDEGLNVGQPCTGTGECAGDPNAVLECDPNTLMAVCSVDPGGTNDQSMPETCDGLDNDCDASTDEDFSVGQSCNGTGECVTDPNGGNGVFECSDPNTSICSLDPGGSQDQSMGEMCDGLDNDCDAQTDEDFMLGQACDGVGECGAGVLECGSDPNAAICSTDIGGSMSESVAEICGNGLDDDCDGFTDEVGGPEFCDGIDNNCDGNVDEGFNIGQACMGAGACGSGVFECSPTDPNAGICSTSPGGSDDQSGPELCDGLDNDCDAQTDEDFNIGMACNGVGECGPGVIECSPTSVNFPICSTDPGGSADESTAELCDGLDNDCDASTDEDFGVGQSCNGMGACFEKPNGSPGMVECLDPSTSICSLSPGGSEDQSSMEVCDDPVLDNDCDGSAEEGGICAPFFVLTSHMSGDTVDCRDPRIKQPRFTWFKGPYDKFRPEIAFDPGFSKKTRIRSYVKLTDPFWVPNGKKWKKFCKKAYKDNPSPTFYIRVFGQDTDLSKKDPDRFVETPVVDLNSQP